MGDSMLIKFEVENFKNFRDKITLDLTESKNYEFNQNFIVNGVINKAIIYGKNGSGKTNLGLALFDILFVLQETNRNARLLPIDSYIDFFNAELFKDVVTFSYTFRFGDNNLNYSYQKKSVEDLVYEELMINGDVVLKCNFENNQKTINIPEAKTLNFNFIDSNISIVKYIANNSNLEKKHPIIMLMEFVKGMFWVNMFQENSYFGINAGADVFSRMIFDNGLLKDLETFLSNYGLKYKLDFLISEGKQVLAFDYGKNKINFFRNASSGTRDLVWIYFWKQQLKKITFLYIDEFDAFYHYELALEVMKLINSIEEVQSIITTHNTFLISNDFMRPDCYFKIHNNKIKNFPQLTIKDIRQAQNLEKMYRNGEFE